MDQIQCGEAGCSELASYVGAVETGSVFLGTMQEAPDTHSDLYKCPAGHSTWVRK